MVQIKHTALTCILVIALAGGCSPDGVPEKRTETLQLAAPVRLMQSPLVEAARRCDPDSFRSTLQNLSPERINAQVQGGETALTHAVWFRQTDCVRMLLNAGARVNTRTDGKETALHYSLYRGSMEITILLLENGADPRAQEAENGYTVLMIASGLGRHNAVRALLMLGADSTVQDYQGRTALMHAIRGAHNESAALLIRSPTLELRDTHKETALYYAIRAGDQETFESILAAGADPNARNELHESPLMLAASRGNREMIRTLLAYGAQPNLLDATGNYDARRIARVSGFEDISSLLDSPFEIWMIRLLGK